MTTITYVTGCSGSGKTSLYEKLAAGLDEDTHVFELDHSDQPPNAAHVEWLEWRAAELLHGHTDDARSSTSGDTFRHVIVTGIVWPFRLISSTAWEPAMDAGLDVRFLLLDRPWQKVADHLAGRLADWEPEDRDEQIDNNRRLQRILRRQVGTVRGGLAIGGSRHGDLDLDRIAEMLLSSPTDTW